MQTMTARSRNTFMMPDIVGFLFGEEDTGAVMKYVQMYITDLTLSMTEWYIQKKCSYLRWALAMQTMTARSRNTFMMPDIVGFLFGEEDTGAVMKRWTGPRSPTPVGDAGESPARSAEGAPVGLDSGRDS
ncbi:hypothetical protein EYF80_025015 [Liparis tanakae]|uniref:Uncharacterized protein n=1 Tax=Liparis tanakae TaxID=230148 RepID=A0A4Z2HH01_9TELE|nr:hypothetical protein EYF80_025015 [Liparis tanakae]